MQQNSFFLSSINIVTETPVMSAQDKIRFKGNNHLSGRVDWPDDFIRRYYFGHCLLLSQTFVCTITSSK